MACRPVYVMDVEDGSFLWLQIQIPVCFVLALSGPSVPPKNTSALELQQIVNFTSREHSIF